MPKGWEEEVREILERAGELEARSPKRAVEPPTTRGAGLNPVSTLGDAVKRRFASPREMVVTAMILVVAALLLTIVPFGRYVSPYLAGVGAVILVAAYARSLMSGAGRSSGLGMWRGRVVQGGRSGLLKRLFGRRGRRF